MMTHLKWDAYSGHHHSPLTQINPARLDKRMAGYYIDRYQNTWQGRHLLKGLMPDDNAVQLINNDYLNIANHPEIVAAQTHSLNEHGNGLMMSGVFLKGDTLQSKFERKMAAFLQTDDAMLSQSGWCANTGLLQSIADENSVIYMDMMAHMSLWEGAQISKATIKPFRHNDVEHLKRLIAQFGPGIIVVDSVYSTVGDVCPLTDVVKLGCENDCILVVDESHSLGTHGPQGAGMVVEAGLSEQVHFRTASLAKGFAGRGGIIAGSAKNIEYIRYEARPAIFSSSVLAHEIAGFIAGLEVIKAADEARARLHRNADQLRYHVKSMGYNVGASESQILALEAGPEQATMQLRDALESRGVFGAVFCAPATPKNRSLIRLAVNSDITKAQISKVAGVCYVIRDEVGMWEWPSTKRLRRKPKSNSGLESQSVSTVSKTNPQHVDF